jgi:hypothetical protein
MKNATNAVKKKTNLMTQHTWQSLTWQILVQHFDSIGGSCANVGMLEGF